MFTTTDFPVGSRVKLKTYNTYNNSDITGTVAGIITYEMARGYSNVLNYNEQVKSATATMDVAENFNTIESDKFVAIKLPNNDIEAYAIPWVSDIEVLDLVTDVDITLINVNGDDVIEALAILQNGGFVAKKKL